MSTLQKIFFALIFCVGLFVSDYCLAHQFNIISNVDEKASLSLEDYKKIGIEKGWFHCKMPVKIVDTDEPVWVSEKEKNHIENIFKKFEDSGISIFIMPSIWGTFFGYDKDCKQITAWEQKGRYRSFSTDTQKIEICLKFLIKELKKFSSFGGICLDDEPAVMAGGCFHQNTVLLFKKQYKINPPSLKDYRNIKGGIIKNDNPILLWSEFQQQLLFEFYKKLMLSVKEIDSNCPVYIVPAASWICGKTISISNSPPEKTRAYKLGILDPCYIKDFQLYTQYSFNLITDTGWGDKIADGQCQAQFYPPNAPRTIVPIYDPYQDNSKAISVEAFRRYVLQTLAEGARGIGYWPIASFSPKHVLAAEEIHNNYIKPICKKTGNLTKLKGKVAVLFSTSTSAFADIWQDNPIERFKHNHQCEALSYYLFKRGIPFDIILENELRSSKDLHGYYAVISAGVDFMTKKSARILKKYIRDGGKVIFNTASKVKIPRMISADFDADIWYRAIVGQYHRALDLEYQIGAIHAVLANYLLDSLAICRSSSRHLNVNYLMDDNNLYLFIVNDDLFGKIKSKLVFNKTYKIYDVLADKNLGSLNSLNISLKLGTLQVLKLQAK